MRAAILCSVLCVAACAHSPQDSYVAPVLPETSSDIAGDMAVFVRGRIKPTDGPVQIDQQRNDRVFGSLLATDLASSGFVISRSPFAKHHVRYSIATLDGDVMIRVAVDGADGARLYRDNHGVGLAPVGPFSVTEIER